MQRNYFFEIKKNICSMLITVAMFKSYLENSQLISSFKLQNCSTHSESEQNNIFKEKWHISFLKRKQKLQIAETVLEYMNVALIKHNFARKLVTRTLIFG